jgi:DNA-binding transcriptional LysR family regulator
MQDLNDFFLFVQVVDRGGFTAASRTLRTPKPTLSHRIRQLEGNLGLRLLNRTSRKFGRPMQARSSTGTRSRCCGRRNWPRTPSGIG